MVLTEILKNSSRRFRSRTAYTMKMGFRTVSLSYGEVFQLAKRVALFLDHAGIKKGDKVAILAPNSPYWCTLFWGCMLRGVVVVPLNVQSTPEMVAKILQHTEAKLFFDYLLHVLFSDVFMRLKRRLFHAKKCSKE